MRPAANRHLEEWAKGLNQGLFPTCVGGIAAALVAAPHERGPIAFGGLIAAYAVLVMMIFCHAPVTGGLRLQLRNWRQNNYLANDLARTVIRFGPLFKRAWPAFLGWFLLSGIALIGALKG